MFLLLGPVADLVAVVLGCVLGVALVVTHGDRSMMALAHVSSCFLSVPVAVVGVTGMVLALVFDPTVVGAAVVTVIIALTAGIVAILSKLGETKLALATIAHSVDGAASASANETKLLRAEIAFLHQLLDDRAKSADQIAAATAATPASVAAAVARAEGEAAGVDKERARGETKP